MPLTAISITRSGLRAIISSKVACLIPPMVAGVAVIHLVCTLFAGYSNFFCVQNDDVVTGINVRGVFRFMLAAQTTSEFSSETA
ncbi:Uncharacterised protein [Serratia plymuthica]|nr:Uncharacterised protein [Serratia plymuthica]